MLSSAMDAIHAVSRAQYRAAFLDTYPLTCPTVHETNPGSALMSNLPPPAIHIAVQRMACTCGSEANASVIAALKANPERSDRAIDAKLNPAAAQRSPQKLRSSLSCPTEIMPKKIRSRVST